ncbi:MAG: hypothetical protein U9R33_02245, partial [candidate division NC10 bacterium]|nr:hypothetical protein [candidate division NC10 bacterium]
CPDQRDPSTSPQGHTPTVPRVKTRSSLPGVIYSLGKSLEHFAPPPRKLRAIETGNDARKKRDH